MMSNSTSQFRQTGQLIGLAKSASVVVLVAWMLIMGARFVVSCSQNPLVTESDSTGDTPLISPTSELSLGTIQRGTRSSTRFTLYNPGRKTVTVTRVETDCDCLQLLLERTTVPPRGTIAGSAVVDFTEDPGYTGSLLLKATGWEHGPENKAFILGFAVDVR